MKTLKRDLVSAMDGVAQFLATLSDRSVCGREFGPCWRSIRTGGASLFPLRPTMMGIETLLQAAEFLDRREREAEHGYASSLPVPVRSSNRRKTSKQRKSQGSKSMHNELEKNRRAQLRYFLEQLKHIVPLGADSSRHTTLRLLTDARSLIKSLEDTGKYQRRQKDQLLQEQKALRWELARQTAGMYRLTLEHSLSESSSASSASTSSSFSAGDDVDITSLSCTGLSDSEDQASSSSSSSIINDLRL